MGFTERSKHAQSANLSATGNLTGTVIPGCEAGLGRTQKASLAACMPPAVGALCGPTERGPGGKAEGMIHNTGLFLSPLSASTLKLLWAVSKHPCMRSEA